MAPVGAPAHRDPQQDPISSSSPHSPSPHSPPHITSPFGKHQGRREQSSAEQEPAAAPSLPAGGHGRVGAAPASPPTADTRLTSPPLPAAAPPDPPFPRDKGKTQRRGEHEGLYRGAAPLQHTLRTCGVLRWEPAWRGGCRGWLAPESAPCLR